MKPYYEHAGIMIFHGDCNDILPQLGFFDLVLTDPPYGIGEADGKNKSRGTKGIEAKDFGTSDWDDHPISDDLYNLVISKGKKAIVFGGNYYRNDPSKCWLVWDKDNTGDFADCELAWTNLDKAVRKITYRWNGMLQQKMGVHKEERWHPTQKPLAVMTWCILQAPGTTTIVNTILDPFMGVGTTLRAAKDLGHKAVGIEREEKYCEIAAKRLSQEVFQFKENL